MTTLVQINQGTPPAGSDGDTVRAAFTKVNTNTAVLQAQAALTNASQITAAQALTNAHVGKRVNFNLATAGTVNMPPISGLTDPDNVTLLRNLGNTVVTFAPASGTSDWVGLSKLNPGESALMDGFGGAWNVLMRGRARTDNETVNGTLTVNGGIAGNLAATGKIAGANNPNLLLNGSAEFGLLGWVGQFLANPNDSTGATGSGFYCPALTGATILQTSANIPVGAGVPLTLSARMNTGGLTAGLFSMRLEAFNSSNASLGMLCISQLLPGNGWTSKYANGTTPAGTTYVKAEFYCDGSPTGGAFAVNIQQIKVELGTAPSLYSQEASIAYLQGSPALSGRPTFAGNTPWDSGNFNGAQAFGVGQTLQDVSSSRFYNTNYTNTTTRPIYVYVTGTVGASGNGILALYIAGQEVSLVTMPSAGQPLCLNGLIPPGAAYQVGFSGSVNGTVTWKEYR